MPDDPPGRFGPGYRVWGGGPLDGRTIPYRGEFFEDGGAHRLVGGGYVFLGHAARRCGGCGCWLVPPPDAFLGACPLCGATGSTAPKG